MDKSSFENFSILDNVAKEVSSKTNGQNWHRLTEIVDDLRKILKSDSIILHVFDPFLYNFEVPIYSGNLKAALLQPIKKAGVIWKIIANGPLSHYSAKVKTDKWMSGRFVIREEIVSAYYSKLYYSDNLFCGVIFINWKFEKQLTTKEKQKIEAEMIKIRKVISDLFNHWQLLTQIVKDLQIEHALFYPMGRDEIGTPVYIGDMDKTNYLDYKYRIEEIDLVFNANLGFIEDIEHVKVLPSKIMKSLKINSIIYLRLTVRKETMGILVLKKPVHKEVDSHFSQLMSLVVSIFVINFSKNLAEKEAFIYRQQTNLLLKTFKDILNSRGGLKQLLEYLLGLTMDITGAHFGTIHILNKDNLDLQASLPLDKSEIHLRLIGSIGLKEKSVITRAINQEKNQYVANVYLDNEYRDLLGEGGSEICVLLKNKGRIVGTLDIEHREVGGLHQDDLQIIEMLSNMFEIAIRRTREIELLNLIAKMSSNYKNTDEIWEEILKGALMLTGGDYGSLLIYDEETMSLSDRAVINYPAKHLAKTHVVGDKSIVGWVAKNKESVMIGDVNNDEMWKSIYYPGLPGSNSELTIPIIDREFNALLGIINIESSELFAFDPQDKMLVEQLAEYAANAIVNLGLHEYKESYIQKLSGLHRAADAVTRAWQNKPEILLEIILNEASIVTNANFGVAILNDERDIEFTSAWPPGIEKERNIKELTSIIFENSIFSEVVRHGESKLFQNFLIYQEMLKGQVSKAGSVLLVPLLREGIPFGLIYLEHNNINWFEKEDLQILEAFATLASTAYDNSKFHALRNEYLSNVIHEIRPPITRIGLKTQQLQQAVFGAIQVGQYKELESIRVEVNAISSTIKNLKRLTPTLEEKVNPSFRKVNLVKLVRETIDLCLQLKSNKALIEFNPISDDLVCYANETLISTVLRNLIDNAIKFSPEGGEIKVTIDDYPGNLVFRVKDHGPGISPEDHMVIFDRDQSAERSGGGEGLGLNLCKQIILLHRGKIWVESELNQGAQFSVQIPKKGG